MEKTIKSEKKASIGEGNELVVVRGADWGQ